MKSISNPTQSTDQSAPQNPMQPQTPIDPSQPVNPIQQNPDTNQNPQQPIPNNNGSNNS